jgi:hypothetical protein
MKLLKKSLLVATLPLALLIGKQLSAQPADPTAAPAPTTPGAAPVKAIQLSPIEMQSSVKTLEGQVKIDIQHVQHLQTIARKEKDVIKLSCVNDKYVKIKAEANLFDKAVLDLNGVLDRDERHTAYAGVTKSAANVTAIREEAEQCIGEKEMTPTDYGNTFQPPDIPDDPTDDFPFDEDGTVIEPPVYASPYT